jgi:HAD superfamily phosphatase (TIGR01668 family)
MKKFCPTFVAKNIFEIDPNFFLAQGKKYILIDLDNTLAAYYSKVGGKREKEYLSSLRKAGLTPMIVSNNSRRRVMPYAGSLNIEASYRTYKPFVLRLKGFLKKKSIKVEQCILIGDQPLTDIWCANRLKMSSILTEKLVEKDQFITKINRFFDKIIRDKLYKKYPMISWRDANGRIN